MIKLTSLLEDSATLYSVECPICKAKKGQPCTKLNPKSSHVTIGLPNAPVHYGRTKAYAASGGKFPRTKNI